MRLNEVVYSTGVPVDGYGPGVFRVGGEARPGALLILPERGASAWGGFEDLAPILAAADRVDVLLLGTGAEIAHPPAEMRERLEAAGVGVEAMASPAACRSYNVLLGEGRRVALAALPV
jgi:uncharacterized protein